MSRPHMVALSTLCDRITDGTHQPPKFASEGVPFLFVSNIVNGRVDYKTSKFISSSQFVELTRLCPIAPGDVLYTTVGSYGNAAEVLGAAPFAFQRHIAHIKPRRDLVDSSYLAAVLNAPVTRTQVDRLVHGVAQKTLNLAALRQVLIPLPELAQQRRIADILDRADAMRAKRREAIALLGTSAQAVFVAMFGDPIDKPSAFPVAKLIDLVDPTRPISYGILMPGPPQPAGVMYVRVVDMQDGGINLGSVRKTTNAISDAFRRSLLRRGDLLMSIRGHVGRLAVVPCELEGANITQDTARLAIVRAEPVFVRECLRTEAMRRWMARHTKGVAVKGINLGDVKEMPVPVPPQDEQQRFVRIATAIDKLKAAHRASLAEMDALFASLQHRAFRGEL